MQKTCHWVPIGAMGPADIWTALLILPSPTCRARVRSNCLYMVSDIMRATAFTRVHVVYCKRLPLSLFCLLNNDQLYVFYFQQCSLVFQGRQLFFTHWYAKTFYKDFKSNRALPSTVSNCENTSPPYFLEDFDFQNFLLR